MSNAICQGRECGVDLAEGRAFYCEDCAVVVWAFRPNADVPDEWFVIHEDYETLDGEQCGVCGGSFYRLVGSFSGGTPSVMCTNGEMADGPVEGCGDFKPVRQMYAHQVIF